MQRLPRRGEPLLFEDVVQGLSEKLIRRHPHVFGNVKRPETPEESLALWKEVKKKEKEKEAAENRSCQVMREV